jgi:hypothetical protein
MNLTSSAQIRSHLQHIQAGGGHVRDTRIVAPLDGWADLPHARLAADSEKIKAVESDQPTFSSTTLTTGPVTLPHGDIVPGTVVVAADSSLSIIYQEHVDFTLDYVAGQLQRLPSGAIASGKMVAVWYTFYRVYEKGTDYEIDYVRGRWMRHVSGAIEPGQELLIDYQLSSGGFSDEEIEQVITEADAEVTRETDPAYADSTDPALQSAATFLALSYLCRNAAAASLSSPTARPDASSHWLTLSGSYRETAMRLLRWFRKPSAEAAFPKLA